MGRLLDTPVYGLLAEGSLGDSLMYIPVIRALQVRHGGYRIVVIGRDPDARLNIASVLGGRFPGVEFIYLRSGARTGFGKLYEIFSMARIIRKNYITHLYDGCRFEGSRTSLGVLAKRMTLKCVSRAAVIPDLREIRRQHESPAPGQAEHISQILLRRVIPESDSTFADRRLSHLFPIQPADDKGADQWLIANNVSDPRQLYFAGLLSKRQDSVWPVENFLQVMIHLKEKRGLLPVFSGGPADRPFFSDLISRIGGGYLSLPLSFGAEAAVMKKARFFLGVNSGPMHLAASAGQTCVVVSVNDLHHGGWDPIGTGHRVVVSAAGVNKDTVIEACESLLTEAAPKLHDYG